MNEYTLRTIKRILAGVVFCVCMGLIVTGQRTIGFASLGQMLLGLAGILALLYLYNRRFTRTAESHSTQGGKRDE